MKVRNFLTQGSHPIYPVYSAHPNPTTLYHALNISPLITRANNTTTVSTYDTLHRSSQRPRTNIPSRRPPLFQAIRNRTLPASARSRRGAATTTAVTTSADHWGRWLSLEFGERQSWIHPRWRAFVVYGVLCIQISQVSISAAKTLPSL